MVHAKFFTFAFDATGWHANAAVKLVNASYPDETAPAAHKIFGKEKSRSPDGERLGKSAGNSR